MKGLLRLYRGRTASVLCRLAIASALLLAALVSASRGEAGCSSGGSAYGSPGFAPEMRRSSRVSTLDLSNFPQERAQLLQADQQAAFPHLGSHFEVLAPSTPVYNCVSHTLGVHDTWINPANGPADNPLSRMDQMYAAKGFRRTGSLDFGLQPGKRKIVVYAAVSNGQIGKITHAALQMPDGNWSSKLGKLSLIRHTSPRSLEGPSYGKAVAVYVAS